MVVLIIARVYIGKYKHICVSILTRKATNCLFSKTNCPKYATFLISLRFCRYTDIFNTLLYQHIINFNIYI